MIGLKYWLKVRAVELAGRVCFLRKIRDFGKIVEVSIDNTW
jgi:hypothetical protein